MKTYTINEVFKWIYSTFLSYSIPEPFSDAKLLLAHSLNLSTTSLFSNFNNSIDNLTFQKIKKKVDIRIKRVPLAYILNYKYFYKYKFYVNENVLIPRPETELLIEELVKYDLNNKKILDIGTGSGNIGISLKKEFPLSKVVCIDISKESLEVARKNANNILFNSLNDIYFFESDVYSKINEKFDYIVSNPPYILKTDFNELMPEVKYEPTIALFAGNDGMIFYNKIINSVHKYLKNNGFLVLEINPKLKLNIISLIRKNKLKIKKIIRDYTNYERIIIAQKNN